MSRLIVKAVQTGSEKKQFFKLPWSLYRGDPNWVPPLRANQWHLLNYRPHPFYEDGEILVSTVTERLKYRNVRANPAVSFAVVDPERPLRYLEVRGTVDLRDDPDNVVRDAIASKHGFADGGAFDPPGSTRVSLVIRPSRVIEH